MAAQRKAAEEPKTEPEAVEEHNVPSAPKGMQQINAVSDAPWFEMKAGAVLYAKLLSREVMQDEDNRAYFQLELLEPADARYGKGDDARVDTASKGAIVNLNETAQTRNLTEKSVPNVNAGAIVHVWMLVKSKIKLSAGRTMWDLDLRHEMKSPPKTRPVPVGGQAIGEDTPF
jgi:hypothetical protein